ncbi:cytochrome-c oxidase, cbb3-type subunit I [Phaeocystidibacter marisrubri]|uniref:cytochrome-c oxidase n=1 Tax=Phaeocystidibacter marisrubri TaxID=1577780 RepID=A0A6L3ZF17_9FLAO|nr:cytochrome-c oxidase, cbb3-type subunit I [Phaeocystidibacter marisrubri]KAB2815270.1 cytochrome-c oxidase, cbb3-type subunit I [Phaeocystidibacter marisrubri]GGH71226.1 bifunctional cbb3-type cytochrome C oxidase subunit I/II [Phaeocystidibacter marisrubri]
MELEKFHYDNRIVRDFTFATIVWAIVAFLVGITIASQLFAPSLNANLEFLTFGRLRAIHTNAAIFAFVGNAIFAGVYYSLPRLLKTPMASKTLSKIHFWGWQLIILLAAVTLAMGLTSSKEYAELEWPIDILITLIWVVFGVNMFWTILKRRERHLYVAIWFYIATWVTVAVLHIVNNLEVPVGMWKSYSVFAGVQDALVQWWYGHNAVAFFLTTPVLGLMYYFVPKAVNRPVYSYRLSIIHFWALIFIYIWAGPHHLLYTSLPDWAQSLGTVFSIMLIAPSWGGMLNGLLTMRGAWDRVRDSAILKFFVVAITAYGMATLEGPLLSLKNVNAIAHFTDWIPAHVHVGTLGWNGFIIFGMIYYLIPKLYKTKLYSESLANTHFWIGTLGILFWAIPMYIAGFTQSLMWKQFDADGGLVYNFLDTVTEIMPFYIMRAIGGTLYLIGALLMVVNVWKTVATGKLEANEEAEAAPLPKEYKKHKGEYWHRWIERRPVQLLIFSTVVILIGGLVELVPTILSKGGVENHDYVKPYTALELEGRDLYIREGCNACHSQMVRPFRSEVVRYSTVSQEYSKASEFVYDHPFLWGSKRTGPDLHRIGERMPGASGAAWHYNHMWDPAATSPGSIMPRYPWLFSLSGNDATLDRSQTKAKLEAMQGLGVPYTDEYIENWEAEMDAQANEIAEMLNSDANIDGVGAEEEIVALIAYLQKLGTDISRDETATNE